MKKRISFKQFLFLLPLLLLLVVFSVYPIISSATYSLFDYRTNDQTVAGLYTSTKFNAPLFVEDGGYITWYLSDDITLMDENDQAKAQKISDEIDALCKEYEGYTKLVSIDEKDGKALNEKVLALKAELTDIYNSNGDIEFYNGVEKQELLFDEMTACFIKSNFTGLKAYSEILKDSRFGNSLKSTLIFTFISVFFEFVLGMGLALIMNKAIKGIGAVRTVSLIPWAIPTAVSALMWSYMYDGSSGIVAKVFGKR